jgi:hypothetical protein
MQSYTKMFFLTLRLLMTTLKSQVSHFSSENTRDKMAVALFLLNNAKCLFCYILISNKGNNKITELRTILQTILYKQTKSVNIRKTVKTVITLTWYRKNFIFRYQYLVEIYSVSAEKIISDAFSYSENV